jgi:hypothetical protein
MKLTLQAIMVASVMYGGNAAAADGAAPPPVVAPSTGAQTPAAPATAQPASTSTLTQTPANSQSPPPQSSASAATQTGPESVVVQGDRVDLDQIVCKAAPPKTGSRLGGGRECHSQRQWNQMMRESQDITRRLEVTGYNGR